MPIKRAIAPVLLVLVLSAAVLAKGDTPPNTTSPVRRRAIAASRTWTNAAAGSAACASVAPPGWARTRPTARLTRARAAASPRAARPASASRASKGAARNEPPPETAPPLPRMPDAPQPVHLRAAAAHRDAHARRAHHPSARMAQADQHGRGRGALPAEQRRRLSWPAARGRRRVHGRRCLRALAGGGAALAAVPARLGDTARGLARGTSQSRCWSPTEPGGGGAQTTKLTAQLGAMPCVSLPAAPAQKRLRGAASPDRLATLEAVARALGVLEGPDVEHALLRVYRIMTDRTLWSNGRVTTSEVTGGIPPGVRSHDPLSTGR